MPYEDQNKRVSLVFCHPCHLITYSSAMTSLLHSCPISFFSFSSLFPPDNKYFFRINDFKRRFKDTREYSSNRVIGLSRGPATRYDSNAHCESTGGNPVQRTIYRERTNEQKEHCCENGYIESNRTRNVSFQLHRTLIDKTHLLNVFQRLHY